jgi:hypothetical protein
VLSDADRVTLRAALLARLIFQSRKARIQAAK